MTQQVKKLPVKLLGKHFRNFHLKANSVLVCSDKYLGISREENNHGTNQLRDFAYASLELKNQKIPNRFKAALAKQAQIEACYAERS